MANLTTTNISLSTVVLDYDDAAFEDETLTFPGADTYLEGTILARKAVADAVVAAADAGNTGDGTVTLATVSAGPIVPLIGAYTLTCATAITNGGIFDLTDPNGAIVATGLEMTAGAGAATAFDVAGLSFTITDGATDFAAGDFFTLTVAADGTMVVFSPTGAGGAQIPTAVLTYEVSATGAGTVSVRPCIAGPVRRDKLVVDGGGTVTDTIVDQLRDFGIIARSVSELNIFDNQ